MSLEAHGRHLFMVCMQYFLKTFVSMENLYTYFFSGCGCTRWDFLKMKNPKTYHLSNSFLCSRVLKVHLVSIMVL